jgi:hypothetical protein
MGVIFNTSDFGGVCPTDYNDYCYEGCGSYCGDYFDPQCDNNGASCVVIGPCYVSSPIWACGAMKDTGGIAGFAPAPIKVLVDMTGPSITLNPYSPDPTENTDLYYTGIASDLESEIVDIEYEVDNDNNWIDADFIPGPNPDFSFTASGLSYATHTICARAKNGAGTLSTESCDTVTVQDPGPTNAPTEPWFVIRDSVGADILRMGSNGVMEIKGSAITGWVGNPPTSTNDFIIRQGITERAYLDEATGNLYLGGNVLTNTPQATLNNALSGSNNFIIQKADGNVVAYISGSNGALYLLETLEENQL